MNTLSRAVNLSAARSGGHRDPRSRDEQAHSAESYVPMECGDPSEAAVTVTLTKPTTGRREALSLRHGPQDIGSTT